MAVYLIFAGLEEKIQALHKGWTWKPMCQPAAAGNLLEDIADAIAKLQFVLVSTLAVMQGVQRLILTNCGCRDGDLDLCSTGEIAELVLIVLIALLLYLMRQLRPFASSLNGISGSRCPTFNTIRHIVIGASHAVIACTMLLLIWGFVGNWSARGFGCGDSEFNGAIFTIRLLTPALCAYISKMSAILALCHFYVVCIRKCTTTATVETEAQVSTV